ncbi:hypothetical protein CAPTEDRAFT_105214, partial [Capitella teleta]
GNRNLNFLTELRPHKLKITLRDWQGQTRYANYGAFSVGPEADKFRLTLGNYSGDAGEDSKRARSMVDVIVIYVSGNGLGYNNGMLFSTVDRDYNLRLGECVSLRKCAWWHGHCTYANLNGLYICGSYSGIGRGVFWRHWKGDHYSLKHTDENEASLMRTPLLSPN